MKSLFLKFIFIFHIISYSNAQEICNNALDDDADGLIDLLDSIDCTCQGFGYVTNVPSLIPNPSFEQMIACPDNFGQIEYASNWLMASEANQTSYLNTCDYIYNSVVQGGLLPFPDGNGIASAFIQPGWTEYIASCLLQPLVAGQYYTIQLNIATNPILTNSGPGVDVYNNGTISYTALNISLFGTNNCNNLPFSGYGCPSSSSWSLLGDISYTPNGNWTTIRINFVPLTNIAAIAIGAPCILPTSYPNLNQPWCPVFYYDNILLNKTDFFSMVHIGTSGLICTNNLMLIASTDTSGGSWQWYKNGVALIGETDSILDVSSHNYGYGDYTVSYSNGITCGTYTQTIIANQLSEIDFNASSTQGCVPFEVIFNDTLNKPSAQYYWEFGDGQSTNNGGTVSHTFFSPGCFDISLFVISDDSCIVSKTYNDLICVKEAPYAEFDAYPTEISTINNLIVCKNNSINASSYFWDFGDNYNSILTNPNHQFETYIENEYLITLIAKNEFGCSDSISKNIPVNNEPIYYIPNSFTPNGDQLNDIFKPVFINGFIPHSYTFSIFNNWGEQIFTTNNFQLGWEGTVGISNSYVYNLTFSDNKSNDIIKIVGRVNLIR